jgi:hypothetical protein
MTPSADQAGELVMKKILAMAGRGPMPTLTAEEAASALDWACGYILGMWKEAGHPDAADMAEWHLQGFRSAHN